MVLGERPERKNRRKRKATAEEPQNHNEPSIDPRVEKRIIYETVAGVYWAMHPR